MKTINYIRGNMYLYYAGQQKVFKDPKKIEQKCYLPKLFY